MHYPDSLEKLIQILKKLPGIGHKSAERFAFQMITWPETILTEMGEIIKNAKKNLNFCAECGALSDFNLCSLCDPTQREIKQMCIVATVKDVFLIEKTRQYHGLYHVLGGLLSPITGCTPDFLSIISLKNRIKKLPLEEVILAIDSTLEGDATALFLKKELKELGIQTSRLALGLPMGSSLDYIDGGTLATAFTGRSTW
ncbi:MAG: recombination protein RecR [Chlamydiia bacterium]|nr:recombination protein RecR [Chlamydiia bacterium]